MPILKKTLLLITILAVLIVAGGWVYSNAIKPTYNGKIELSTIENETTVYFDDYGIPHIYAENTSDLFFAQGFVHAQDRLFQMELNRRTAVFRNPDRIAEAEGVLYPGHLPVRLPGSSNFCGSLQRYQPAHIFSAGRVRHPRKGYSKNEYRNTDSIK